MWKNMKEEEKIGRGGDECSLLRNVPHLSRVEEAESSHKGRLHRQRSGARRGLQQALRCRNWTHTHRSLNSVVLR